MTNYGSTFSFRLLAFLAAFQLLHMDAAFAQANVDSAVSSLGGLSESISNNMQHPEEYVPKFNNDQSGNGDLYGEGELVPIDPGKGKISNCSTNPADSNLYNRQECEGINFVARNRTIRPNITVSTNDPVISGNRNITSDPRETLEKYKWNLPINPDGTIGSIPNNACPSTTTIVPPVSEERRCTFYKGSENFLCKAPLKVTVTPEFNYQCLDNLGTNSTQKCSKILNMQCSGGGWGDGCSYQGVIPNSLSADMNMSWVPEGNGIYRLTFGTLQDNYWSGPKEYGQFYDRSLDVTINGIAKLDRFSLDKVTPDDYAIIKVNGILVYKTAPVIDRLEHITLRVCTWPTASGGCSLWQNKTYLQYGPNPNDYLKSAERAPGFGASDYPNVDLRPFLHDGVNNIFVRTAVGIGGEFYGEFRTRMACPVNCYENWDNQCATLEQKAK